MLIQISDTDTVAVEIIKGTLQITLVMYLKRENLIELDSANIEAVLRDAKRTGY